MKITSTIEEFVKQNTNAIVTGFYMHNKDDVVEKIFFRVQGRERDAIYAEFDVEILKFLIKHFRTDRFLESLIDAYNDISEMRGWLVADSMAKYIEKIKAKTKEMTKDIISEALTPEDKLELFVRYGNKVPEEWGK